MLQQMSKREHSVVALLRIKVRVANALPDISTDVHVDIQLAALRSLQDSQRSDGL